jgi:hypothetical protein
MFIESPSRLCLCVPLLLLGNGWVKSFPQQQTRSVGHGVSYSVSVVSKVGIISSQNFLLISSMPIGTPQGHTFLASNPQVLMPPYLRVSSLNMEAQVSSKIVIAH